MESASPTIKLKINWIVYSLVLGVAERFTNDYIEGVGGEAVFTKRSLGWFLALEGSHEVLHLGYKKPDLAPGDRMKITFEKV